MANPTDTGWQDLAPQGQNPAVAPQPSGQPQATPQSSAQPTQSDDGGWTDLTKPQPTSTSVTQNTPKTGAGGSWAEEKAGPKEEHPAAQHGLLRRAWDYANTPLADFVLPHGVKTADIVRGAAFEKMFNEAYIPGINDFETKAKMHLGDSPTKAALKAFIAGSAGDTADVAAGFTSPLSVATLGSEKLAANAPGAVGKIAKAVGPLVGSAFTLQGAGQAVEGASDALHNGLNADNASQMAGGAGQMLLGGAHVGKEVQTRVGELGQHVVEKATPQMQESPMGAQIPTRNDSTIGRAVAAGAPEQAAQFAQKETAPAVQKAVGGTIGEAIGSNAETNVTPEDRMGLKGHAHDLIENQARPTFKRVDELSGGELTKAQNKISSGWSQRDMEKVGEGESDKAALYDKYREKLKSEGMDVDDAERNYARGKAAERMAKRMDTATGPTNVEGAPYELDGKKLMKVVDDGIKNGSWSRMGLTEDHVNELKSLAKTAASQTEIPKVNFMLKGLGKLAVGTAGLHGGIIPALEAVSGVSAADYIGGKVSKHILQEAMTDFKATQALNDSIKTGNAQPVIDQLSKNPSWVKRTADYVTDLGKRLWKDQSGELRLGKEPHSQELRDFSKDYTGKDLDTTRADKDERGPAIADAYDKMKHDPSDPKVRATYDALINETKDQWKGLKDRGYTISTSPEQPYANEKEMLKDIRDNKHITVWEGGQPPADHPMSETDPETGMSNNTIFRAVHDILGHGKEGHDFSEAGEENAFRQHSQMYSDAAQPALATETKGQASWVFNHEGVRSGASKPGDSFPEQKAAILPEKFHGNKASGDNEIAKQHNANGGSSFANGQNLSDGYTVSVRKDLEKTVPKEKITAKDVAEYRSRPDVQKALKSDPRAFIGSWVDDGKTYLDISIHVPDQATATRLGAANKQLAIFDLKNKKAIDLPQQKYAFNDNSAEANNAHSVTTRDASGKKIGELSAQETGNVANRQITVRSNQVYDTAERGKGHGKAQIMSLLGNVPEDVKAVKSDISTTKDAQRVWESLQKQFPEAITKKVVGKGDSAKSVWTVDMEKFRSGDHMADLAKQALPETPAVVARPTADPVKAYRQSLAAKEIGTRNPKSASATGVNDPSQLSGLDALNEADKMSPARMTQAGAPVLGVKQKLVAALADYKDNGISHLLDASDPDAAIEKYVNHVKDNLKWLHGATPEAIRGVAKQWYETAHNVTKDIAETNGVSHEQAAAVTAALSPKNDWNNNVGQAERLIKHYAKDRGHAWTSKMDNAMATIRNSEAVSEPMRRALDTIRGKKFNQLTAKTPEALRAKQAMWMRVLDEAHGADDTPIYNPNGQVTGSQTMNWGQIEPIAKGLSILEDGSVDNINRVMGQGHKIRNFYNNIVNPWSERGHTTIDTHVVGAGHLKPYSQEDTEVMHNFGSGNKAGTPSPAKHAATGLAGSYAVHEEAYRRAAKDLGIQPRELQSITWEGIRSLMGDDKKTPELRRAVTNIWRAHEMGELTLDQARNEIVKASGGFSKPSWMSDEDWERNPTEEGDTSFGGDENPTSPASEAGRPEDVPLRALANVEGANPKLVGSRAAGTHKPSSDIDIKLDIPSQEFESSLASSKLEAAGYEPSGSSLVSPKEAAKYKKAVHSGWSRIQHFENASGQKLDVWLNADNERGQ